MLPKARSRGAGHFYFSDKLQNTTQTPTPKPNGPVLTECVILKKIMSSAAEAEVETVHHNGMIYIPVRKAAIEMGHPQGPTPLKTDKSTADGFFTKKIKLKRAKAFDMKIHWMVDRISKKQFLVYWDKGINNWVDYFTKHNPPKHHKLVRPKHI